MLKVALKKSKSLSFVSKEKFLESDAVNVIMKTWWKAIMVFPLIMEMRMKVRVFFFDNSLN